MHIDDRGPCRRAKLAIYSAHQFVHARPKVHVFLDVLPGRDRQLNQNYLRLGQIKLEGYNAPFQSIPGAELGTLPKRATFAEFP